MYIMRTEIWIILISGLLIYDTYYDNKYSKKILSYKKYYKIILISLGSIFVYYLFKKKPEQFKELLKSGNNLFRYLPVSKVSKDIIDPIFDLTNNETIVGSFTGEIDLTETKKQNFNKNNGIIKRNVGETKKRYVASKQNWECGKCGNKLTYTYEIDHIKALKDGGDNSVENLLALCRECHGQKTAESFLK